MLRRRAVWAAVPGAVVAVTAWAAFADDKKGWTVISAAIAAIVGAFAPTVFDRATAAQQRRQMRERSTRGVESAELPESVAWLLHPQKAVVPFFGRGWVLQELEMWAADPQAPAVRLLIGTGGVGKTRLAREFADRMLGWNSRWIRPLAEAEVVGLIESGVLSRPSLLIVDYAETRDRAALAALLCAAQQASGVRVLLLARVAGLWWETLSAAFPQQATLVDALTVPGNLIELPAKVEERSPQEIVDEAMTAFAVHLGRRVPTGVEARRRDADAPVLRLHAEALVAVLGGEHRSGRYDVLTEVLSHEARYWRGTARRSGLLTGDDHMADVALRQAVGLAALLGASDEEQVGGIVRRIPLLETVEPARGGAYVAWLRGLYPADEGSGGLGVVQPDSLAESLAVRVLQELSDEQRTTAFTGLAVAQAARALTVLGRASAHQADAVEMVNAALGADVPRMTEAVMRVGVQFPGLFTPRMTALLKETEIDLSWARQIAKEIPYPSLELGRLALALTGRIVKAFTPETPIADAALWTSVYGLRLGEDGRPRGALMAVQAATDLYRELATANPSAFLPALAMSLNNLATRLAGVGQRDEAVTASQEAVGLYRTLATTSRDTHLPHLAMALSNHAAKLAEAGERTRALDISGEAVELRRALAARNRMVYLSALATSLHNHAAYLAEAGQRAEALQASEEAVELRRELAAGNPDAYLPDLAASLNNHAGRLADAGQRAEALRLSLETVAVYRVLAANNPNAYVPDLAMSLNNLTIELAVAGRRAEALLCAEEAVQLYRTLAARNPDMHLRGLAGSLNTLADQLAKTERRAEAMAISHEAVSLQRELASSNRDAYLPALATAIQNHAARLAGMGRRTEALKVSQEAVDLRRRLAASDRVAYLPDLAMALNNHALRLAENRKPTDALAANRESIDLRRELTAADREAHLPGLAMSLWHAGMVGLMTGAISNGIIEMTAEGVRYLSELSAQQPEAFSGRYRAAANTLSGLRQIAAQVGTPPPEMKPRVAEGN